MRPYEMPRDDLTKEVAQSLSTPTEVHGMFAAHLYLGEGGVTRENRMAELIRAMGVCVEADRVQSACTKAKRELSLRNNLSFCQVAGRPHCYCTQDVYSDVICFSRHEKLNG